MTGWVLGQAGLKKRTRKGLAALILGANASDIDVFFGWVPWAPLATHRGVTHSLIAGLWVLPLGLAGLLWLYDRWQVRRGDTFASGLEMRFGWLLALSFLGCATHPLLDWQTSYAVQLFSPFDLRWYHNDSLFIIDVWIWLMLMLGIGLSRRMEKRGQLRWPRPAVGALAAMSAYIGMNGMISDSAAEAPVYERPYAEPDTIVVHPPPVLFWKREVVWRQEHGIWRGDYDPLASLMSLQEFTGPVPDGMRDPLVRQVLSEMPELTSFRRWSILPIARVERGRCVNVVRFSDARYAARAGGGPMSRTVRVPTNAAGC
jgi:inner membrane protein